MTAFQVVTCADKAPSASYYCWDAFNASLDRYGIKPVVLGWGKPWRGLGSKPKLLKRAIEDGTITADRIIFCDAFDVVFAENPQRIFDEFPELTCDILWNAEKACFPDATLADLHPRSSSPFRYFNSGLSAGLTDVYRCALREMRADELPDDFQNPDGSWVHCNDQHFLMLEFLNGCFAQSLDYKCEFFQTMCNVSEGELDLSGEKIRNTVTSTHPAAFHLNGGCKEFWKPRILAKLGL